MNEWNNLVCQKTSMHNYILVKSAVRKKIKKPWPLVNLLLATPTAFFSIAFTKIFLPERKKRIGHERIRYELILFFPSSFTVLFQIHLPCIHLSFLVLLAHYLGNPWTNSYSHFGSPTSSQHSSPVWLGRLFQQSSHLSNSFPIQSLPCQW